MASKKTTYRVGDTDATSVASAVTPWVIACDGKAVVRTQSNGQDTYMTYRTEQKARVGLAAVNTQLRGAYIHERVWLA